MLSAEENQLLTHVTGDAPMGQMMRRYWVPACLSEEVAEPDCTPVRTTILGERLVVFRDTNGTLAVVDERCPHRLASLALGRNEEGGLRCIYHGWKFNTAGACVDMPTEPGAFGFRDRMKLTSYPTHEAGGMVWTYMGPAADMPTFPEYDWMKLPRNQYAVIKSASPSTTRKRSKARSTHRTRGSSIRASSGIGRSAPKRRWTPRRKWKPRTPTTVSAMPPSACRCRIPTPSATSA